MDIPVSVEELQYFSRIFKAILCSPIRQRASATPFHVGSLAFRSHRLSISCLQRSLSPWKFWRSCRVRNLRGPASLQANTNQRSMSAHSRAPLKWVWQQLSVEKEMSRSHQEVFNAPMTFFYQNILTLNSHVTNVCLRSGLPAIFVVCWDSRAPRSNGRGF